MNSVILTGRLTKDPVSRTTNSGKSVCNFSIAVQESKEDVSYFDVTVWGKVAENVYSYCTKGKMVGVKGRLKQEMWENEGKKNSRVVVIGESVEFLSSNNNNTNDSEGDNAEKTQTEEKGNDIPF